MMELSDINQQESSTWKERGRYQNDGITGLSLEKGKVGENLFATKTGAAYADVNFRF